MKQGEGAAKPARHRGPVSKAQGEPSGQDAVLPLPPGVKLLRTLRAHLEEVGRIAWSPDGRVLVSPSDETIRLWNAETGEFLRNLTGHGGAVWSVAFDPRAARWPARVVTAR